MSVSQISRRLIAALRHYRAGEFRDAEHLCRRILAVDPGHAEANNLLGALFSKAGGFDTAAHFFRQAIIHSPDNARYHNNLGNTYFELGDKNRASACYNQAIKLDPAFAQAHYNLGLVHAYQGRLGQAAASFLCSLEHKPDDADTYLSLGNVLLTSGRLDEAADYYSKAKEADPESARALFNLSGLYREQRKFSQAKEAYLQCLTVNPGLYQANLGLANLYHDQGKLEAAGASFKKAVRVRAEQDRLEDTSDSLLFVPLSTLCPAVFQSSRDIDRYLSRWEEEWRRFASLGQKIDPSLLAEFGGPPPVELIHQKADNRPLKEIYASIYSRSFETQAPTTTGRGKPKVGFIATRGHEVLFLRFMRGIIERLNTDVFEPIIICSGRGRSLIKEEIRKESPRIITIPERPDEAAVLLRSEEFDVLYYWEVGTDAVNYFLPFFKPAPVQCTSWGFPVTSGIPEMDYYLSSELLEISGAEAHYTEKLIQFTTLPTYLFPPPLQKSFLSRDYFNLKDNRHLYLCLQRPPKIHPEFDSVLGEILRNDPAGDLILQEGFFSHWSELLRLRLKKNIPDCFSRIRIIPRPNRQEFLSLTALCDVSLDTFFCSGNSTSYETLALGTPIVTLPADYMRGRNTYGCYQKMGLTDCIASGREDYIKLALRLGTDKEYNEEMRSTIRASNQVLLHDDEAVYEFEQFLDRAVRQARGE